MAGHYQYNIRPKTHTCCYLYPVISARIRLLLTGIYFPILFHISFRFFLNQDGISYPPETAHYHIDVPVPEYSIRFFIPRSFLRQSRSIPCASTTAVHSFCNHLIYGLQHILIPPSSFCTCFFQVLSRRSYLVLWHILWFFISQNPPSAILAIYFNNCPCFSRSYRVLSLYNFSPFVKRSKLLLIQPTTLDFT